LYFSYYLWKHGHSLCNQRITSAKTGSYQFDLSNPALPRALLFFSALTIFSDQIYALLGAVYTRKSVLGFKI
jgi:hypothetical protein